MPQDNLVCFYRRGQEPVPGCVGTGAYGANYCADRPPKRLMYRGADPTVGLGPCEGDCDKNADCEGDGLCFQRDGFEEVPGCNGHGAMGADYCVSSEFAEMMTSYPTYGPSGVPTEEVRSGGAVCNPDILPPDVRDASVSFRKCFNISAKYKEPQQPALLQTNCDFN